MKKKVIACMALIMCATAVVFAQESYTIKSNLKIEGMPAEYASYGEQDIVSYIKGDKHKTEMTSMMGSNTTFFDGKKITSLSDMMGNKTGFTATKEEYGAADQQAKAEAKPIIEYTTEEKAIAGYDCIKATVTTVDKDNKEANVTVWVTNKIMNPQVINSGGGISMDLGDLKGYPLEIEVALKSMGTDYKVKITTSEVLITSIDDSIFSSNTDGYYMLSYKEYQEKMKQARGGK